MHPMPMRDSHFRCKPQQDEGVDVPGSSGDQGTCAKVGVRGRGAGLCVTPSESCAWSLRGSAACLWAWGRDDVQAQVGHA